MSWMTEVSYRQTAKHRQCYVLLLTVTNSAAVKKPADWETWNEDTESWTHLHLYPPAKGNTGLVVIFCNT